MKLTYLCVIILMMALRAAGQQEYFVFIQEPMGQTFYVRMGEESYSSSASGHLILPSLKDSVYTMYLGFPKNRYPEQVFSLKVGRKDRGFELKHMEGSWQLFDLQSAELIRSAGTPKNTAIKKTDEYSQLMAGVVDDTAVLYSQVRDSVVVVDSAVVQENPVPAKVAVVEESKKEAANVAVVRETKKPGGRQPAAGDKKDAGNAQDETKVAKDSAGGVAEMGAVYDRRDIIRYSTENVVEGKLMIFLDRSGPVTDTIRLIVPHL